MKKIIIIVIIGVIIYFRKIIATCIGAVFGATIMSLAAGADYFNTDKFEDRVKIYKNTEAWELAKAISKEDTKKIEKIIEKEPKLLEYRLELKDKYRKKNLYYNKAGNFTILQWAAEMAKVESVKTLLRLGANPNTTISKDSKESNLLSQVLICGDKIEANSFHSAYEKIRSDFDYYEAYDKIFEILVKAGSNVNSDNFAYICRNDDTRVIYVSFYLDEDKVEFILDNAKNINFDNKIKNGESISILKSYINTNYVIFNFTDKSIFYQNERGNYPNDGLLYRSIYIYENIDKKRRIVLRMLKMGARLDDESIEKISKSIYNMDTKPNEVLRYYLYDLPELKDSDGDKIYHIKTYDGPSIKRMEKLKEDFEAGALDLKEEDYKVLQEIAQEFIRDGQATPYLKEFVTYKYPMFKGNFSENDESIHKVIK